MQRKWQDGLYVIQHGGDLRDFIHFDDGKGRPRGVFGCPSQMATGEKEQHGSRHYEKNQGAITKVTKVKYPGSRMLIMDIERIGSRQGVNVDNRSRAFSIVDGALWRHRNGRAANVTFIDGHAESMSPNQVPEAYDTPGGDQFRKEWK